MWELLLQPFGYEYMTKAIVISALVGGVCAFLSAYLMLKGWSLIGDALSHAVVPGVAIAYALALPYAIGAFLSGLLAALAILWVKSITKLREDAIIGFIFTTFFALGLFIISLNPTSVDVQSIILGNVLGIDDSDMLQVGIIIAVCVVFLLIFWKDLLLVFFDESHAVSVGISPLRLKVLFFTLLSACVVAALQTVGAILVIAMVITPGATAYLLTDRFGRLLTIAVALGVGTSAVGAYLSYFLDGATGGVIVFLQTLLFLAAFFFSPKYGVLSQKYRRYALQSHSAQSYLPKKKKLPETKSAVDSADTRGRL
ncbi:manganese/iron transport system permease protein [Pasteurella testudinis DSM 23072]|uniref:Manganese/iron transport system permease protein n=1 Tax=Pasteurella testudinis DSM 23072 TaxID=1122938 RepID=A0A1W1UC29_9PAST|nr:metal ABC transporter permease [Pasteurella testudinis]SMB78619.1 manganese/iron transport system permease protein [Pasteurella testudinis DSM 23072]SUB52537.1 iron transport system membrane protein [Pasteurella testudinis]